MLGHAYAWSAREGRRCCSLYVNRVFHSSCYYCCWFCCCCWSRFCCLVWFFFLNWVTHVAIKAEIVCVYNIHNKLNTHNQHQNYAHSVRILISKIIILYTYTHTHDCRVVYSKSYQLVTRKNISSKNCYMHMYLIHSCIYVFMSYIVYKYVYMYMILRGWRKTWSLTLC